MLRLGLNIGTREEIVAELDSYGKDRAEHGKTEKAQAFARAIAALEDGAQEVTVGQFVYRVDETA